MCEYTLKNNLANSRPFLFFFTSYVQIDQTCFPSGRKYTKTNKNMDPKERAEVEEYKNEDIDYLEVFSHIDLLILGIIILELNLRYFT